MQKETSQFEVQVPVKIIAALLLSCCAFGQDKITESAVETAESGPGDVKLEVNIDASAHPKCVETLSGRKVSCRMGQMDI